MIQALDTVDVIVVVSNFCYRRIQQLEARSEALEAKLDASACESGQAMRRAQRQDGEVATLASELESLQQQMAKQQQEADAEVTSLQEQLQQQQRQARADVEVLQKQLEAARQEARGSQAAAADEQARARDMQLSCSRQMHELELRVQEAIRQAQSADRDRQRMEAEVAAAEVSLGTG
jgi:chromosome segregation ATPase